MHNLVQELQPECSCVIICVVIYKNVVCSCVIICVVIYKNVICSYIIICAGIFLLFQC
jgi:hypothetical protein